MLFRGVKKEEEDTELSTPLIPLTCGLGFEMVQCWFHSRFVMKEGPGFGFVSSTGICEWKYRQFVAISLSEPVL